MEPITEIIFESVRQLHFPNSPSRLSSLYASKSIAQAEQWQKLWSSKFGQEYGQTAQSLWKIEYETDASMYDAALLDTPGDDFSYLLILDNAHKYWQGKMTNEL